MKSKNRQIFILFFIFFSGFFISNVCLADTDYQKTFLDGAWAPDCNPELKAMPAFFFENSEKKINMMHLYGNQINQEFQLSGFTTKDNTIRYQYEYKGKESRETIEIHESEFKVLWSTNSYNLRENSIFKNCDHTSSVFKSAQRAKIKLQKYRSLIKSGVQEVDAIDLIVNINEYLNKKILIQCTVNLMGVNFGNCRSRDDSQSITIEKNGIDKDFYKWLLTNCSRQFYRDNNSNCRNVWVTGVATNVPFPGIKNLKLYEYEEDFPFTE